MTVLALDVGLSNTGYVVWDSAGRKVLDAGVISPVRRKGDGGVMLDLLVQCDELANAYKALLDRHNPGRILAEFPVGGGMNAKALRGMCMSSAVIGVVSGRRSLSLVSPHAIKKLAGEDTSKKAIIRLVRRKFPSLVVRMIRYRERQEHIADAAMCLIVGGFL